MSENIYMILEVTITISVLIICLLLLNPLLKRRYGARVCYFLWIAIAVRLLIPININVDKPLMIETPKIVINEVYNKSIINDGNTFINTYLDQ